MRYLKHAGCGFKTSEPEWEGLAVYTWDINGDGVPVQFFRCRCGSDITASGSLASTIPPPPSSIEGLPE